MTDTPKAMRGPQTREFQVRAAEGAERTFTGIAVPWDTEIEILGYRESIAAGAVSPAENVLVLYRHSDPIGRVSAYRDTKDGWEITGVISDTPTGQEAYTLLRDGVIDRMSIGFDPVTDEVTRHDDGTLSVRRTEIAVREVSLVPFPAYDTAKVAAVREAPNPASEEERMTESTITAEDLTQVRESIESLERRVELGLAPAPAEPSEQFRSFGDYVKAVARGDEQALRAYTGATTGDTVVKDAWLGSLVRILGGKQPIKNSFTTGALPAEGNGVEYAVLKSDTTSVTAQAAEGTDLAFGKVAIETKTASIGTYGGYSTLSRQAIERSNVGILDTTFTALAVKYAKAIELLTRGVIDTAYAAAGGAALDSVSLPATGDVDVRWTSLLIDLAEKFDDNERTLEGLFVSKAVFLTLAGIEAKDRFLRVDGGTDNAAGSINVPGIRGNVATIPVRVFPGWTGNKALAYDSFAVKTLESPGSPLRLQDENIVNLSKDFSVYGYAAAFVQAPDALVKVTFA